MDMTFGDFLICVVVYLAGFFTGESLGQLKGQRTGHKSGWDEAIDSLAELNKVHEAEELMKDMTKGPSRHA